MPECNTIFRKKNWSVKWIEEWNGLTSNATQIVLVLIYHLPIFALADNFPFAWRFLAFFVQQIFFINKNVQLMNFGLCPTNFAILGCTIESQSFTFYIRFYKWNMTSNAVQRFFDASSAWKGSLFQVCEHG